ncbi:flavin reductase family protein [Helicobacter cappadocius]|uniref:Flavin reductase family protein n=1 Tax=Helicobacter cappadocius TaxID=3063998 RepID=A0AA90PMC6_9HELI|nr:MULTISPECIES: flavin reductase family protein [unclassified Helicobacter]MDO7253919.1 flavin reductase family protein [Helicobacter sp. faydin-H75]MDP2539784.1 flavin reductase family protein [Helicobacter sp. faydin-H76]
MQIDFASSSPLMKYKILSNSITPRPIAWISTISENGVLNLAPFSFFGVLSADPVIFSVCISPKSDGNIKDTLKNILQNKKATIAMIEQKNLKSMHQSSQELPYEISEAVKFNIQMEIIHSNYPPIPKETNVAFMCEFYDSLDIGKNSQSILLQAKECFIDDKIYTQDLHFTLQNIGRVGNCYQISSQLVQSKDLN